MLYSLAKYDVLLKIMKMEVVFQGVRTKDNCYSFGSFVKIASKTSSHLYERLEKHLFKACPS